MMKKNIFLGLLLVIGFCQLNSQNMIYSIHGNVEVPYKHYDLINFIGKSEYADLLLVINKNQQELLQSGPTKNDNLCYFTIDKFDMTSQDTLHINCWDMDKNSIWLLYLNGDDFICRFDIPCVGMLDSTRYRIQTSEGQNLNMYIDKYYNAAIKIVKYKPARDLTSSEKKMIRKGLYYEMENGKMKSALIKSKKGKFEWTDVAHDQVYAGQVLTYNFKDINGDSFMKADLSVEPGRHSLWSVYGEVEIEIIPE
jgi:hypothetical protein